MALLLVTIGLNHPHLCLEKLRQKNIKRIAVTVGPQDGVI